jgi:hypothetical protein
LHLQGGEEVKTADEWSELFWEGDLIKACQRANMARKIQADALRYASTKSRAFLLKAADELDPPESRPEVMK